MGDQHALVVADPTIQPLLALVDPLEDEARDQRLEGAAHGEPLVGAMAEGLARGGVQHRHAQPTAAARLQGAIPRLMPLVMRAVAAEASPGPAEKGRAGRK
jgi:hypothetical protein